MDDARGAIRSGEKGFSVAARAALSRCTYQRAPRVQQLGEASRTLAPSRTQAADPTTAARSSLGVRPGRGTDASEARQGGGSSGLARGPLLIGGLGVEEGLGGVGTARDLERGSLEAGGDHH